MAGEGDSAKGRVHGTGLAASGRRQSGLPPSEDSGCSPAQNHLWLQINY